MVVLRLVLGLVLSLPLLCQASRSSGPRRPRVRILHESFADEDSEDNAVYPPEDSTVEPRGVAGWPVVHLNEQIFRGNVLREDDDYVKNWVVYWCPDWWEPCQDLLRNYTEMAQAWHEHLSEGALMTLPVRFARVNCATDKVLCNTMLVDDYPTVQHYSQGEFQALWTGRGSGTDAPRSLTKWLNKQLGSVPPAANETGGRLVAEVATFLQDAASEYLVPGDHAVDILLVLTLLLVNFWAVSHSPSIWQNQIWKEQKGLDLEPGNLSSTAAASEVPVPQGKKTAPQEAELEPPPPRCSRLERMLPEEWHTQRATLDL